MKANKDFLREAVAEIVCCDVDEIKDDTDFIEELDVSSVQMLEIVAAVEDEYDIMIKATNMDKYNTINKIAAALEEL